MAPTRAAPGGLEGGGADLGAPLVAAAAAAAPRPRRAAEAEAGPWQTLTFGWLSGLIAEGHRREVARAAAEVSARRREQDGAEAARGGSDAALVPASQLPGSLEEADLLELRPDDVPEALRERVEEAWARELARHSGEAARRVAEEGAEAAAATGAPDPSFRRALSAAFGGTFVAAGVFKFMYDSLQMVGPYVLKRFLHYLNECDADDGQGECDVRMGLLWIGLLIGSNLLQTAILHQYFHRAFRTGMRLNCASISLIYAKSLRIAGPGRGEGNASQGQQQGQQRTSGEIVNLMSVDSQRLQDTMTYLHTLWSGPYQITITLVFLAYVVHWATLAGLAVMLLQIPVVTLISRRIKLAQKKLMKIKDERIKVTNELFGSIKLLKMYGWEESFGVKLDSIREAELKQLRKYQILNIVSSAIWSTAPILTGVATFGVYTALYGDLNAATAFTALSLFNVLRFPLTMFPNMVTSAVEATIALQRITDFLCSPEIGGRAAPPEIQWQPQEGGQGPVAVRLSQVSLAWPGGVPLLSDLSLVVPAPLPTGERAHLTVVLGAVGTGKSGLLQALIGDLGPQSGTVAVVGSIAYASQVSWIRNTSVKDNILFNSPFSEERYRAVLEGCALLPDLEALPNGEDTEIGEKGVNLSGGQKQRVSLARALYAAPHLLLLDDPLSAVDAEVAQKLLRTLRGPLVRGSSIVLCTNYVGAVAHADQVLLLERPDPARGSVAAFCGPPAEFRQRYPDVSGAHDGLQRQLSGAPCELVEGDGGEKKKDSGRLVEREAERVGSVPWGVYRAYLGAGGGLCLTAAVILGMILGQGVQTCADSWVSFWSDHSRGDARPHVSSEAGLLGYVVLSFTAFFGIFATSSLFRLTALNAARSFHRQLLEKMLQLPMSFYDTTPLGRVLNRFSKDVYTVDEQLQGVLYMYMTTLARVTATVVVIAVATPWFIAVVVPLLCLYRAVQNYYVPSSRQLKRIESTLRSPIFSHFTESLEGVSSIRAFGQQAQFLEENAERLRRQMRAYYNNVSSNRWLAVRLETLGTTIVGAAGLLAVESRHTISAGLAGLSISYGLSVTQSLNWVVRMTSDRETAIVSVERIREYILLSPEPPRRCPRTDPPPGAWPTAGAIEFQDLKLRYRPSLPLVLQGFSLRVGAREKLGICGRTGAGKSSILNVLLRLVEPEEGRTMIDGVDIATLGLHRLRLSITIIPQDPVLFTGALRFNLDPLGQHSDGALWTALRRSHLEAHVQTLGGEAQGSGVPRDEAACLSSLVAEQGANFSLGQRQQMCLARALLCSNKILLLDEATSAVDQETDRRIQDTIREEFAEHTVLCIAHRLATIREFDRVCVVDAGRVAETGLPGDMLEESVALQLSLRGVDLGRLGAATGPEVLAELKDALRHAVAKEASARVADVAVQVAGDAAAIKATVRTSAAAAAARQAALEASGTLAASVAAAVQAVPGIGPALDGVALSASVVVSRSLELTLRRS